MTSTSQPLPYDPNDSDSIERYNNRKLTADKIRQILSKVRNNAGDSARRWIWELMQNAKDVKNAFGGVSIEIVHLNDKVRFSHNGEPFTLAHLHSLVQQVSSKSSTNTDEEVTGKFGTGFIATHLLSSKIKVEGIVALESDFRKIELLLDREGDSSEVLIDKIGLALDRLKKTDNREVFRDYHETHQLSDEDALLTTFTYELTTDESRKAATNGIKDIVETLPIAMLTNGSKIKKVSVVDNSGTVTYQRGNPVPKGYGIDSIVVRVSGDNLQEKSPSRTLYAFTSESSQVTLITEIVNDGLEKLSPIRAKTPILYRDFPLIGSEKFHFPFIINGKDFNPTEDRNGIVLHAEEDKDAVTNRERIKEAFTAAKDFTKGLIAIGVDNRYLLAKTRMPSENWDADFSKGWFEGLQEDYRNFLVDLPLVKTENGENLTIREVSLPEYGANKETRLEFYRLVKPFLGSGNVPLEKDIINWLECTGPQREIESWPVKIRFGLEDLLLQLNECQTLAVLEEKLEGADTIGWLEILYDFLVREKKQEFFQEYAIVPNCYGLLMKVEENKLYKENTDDPLSDHFLNILKDVDPENDWRKIVVDRRLKDLSFVSQKKGLSELSIKLNRKLSARNDADSKYNLTFSYKEISYDVIGRILSVEPLNTTRNSLRSRLYNHVRVLFGWPEEPVLIKNANNFSFNSSLRILIHLVNGVVERSEDISTLSGKIRVSEDECVEWLNVYLEMLNESDEFRMELETGKIFINQYQQFDDLINLQDAGTTEYPLPSELIAILYGLKLSEDWAANLIDQRITVSRGNAKTFDELGNILLDTVNSILGLPPEERAIEFEEKNESLTNLIEWSEDNKELATKFLPSFERQSKNLFFDLNFGGGKLRISDMKMLKDEGVVDLLHKINKSELSTKQVESLIAVVTLTTLEAVIGQAKELKEEDDHKMAMLKIGLTAEKAIQLAIQQIIPTAEVSRPTGGRGSFDIRVTNPQNRKSFDIEIKSYAYGRGQYFLFAPAQARRVIGRTPGFAICILERKANDLPMYVEYIRENLQTCRVSSKVFQQGYDDYLQHREIKDRTIDPSKLAITVLGDPRIKVDGNHLKMRGRDFITLINDIKLHIQ